MKKQSFVSLIFTLFAVSAGLSQDAPTQNTPKPTDEFGNPLIPRSTNERAVCAKMVIENVLASTEWSPLIITKVTVPLFSREYHFEAKDEQNNYFSGWIKLTSRKLRQEDPRSGRILSDRFWCSIPSDEYHQGEDVFVLRNSSKEIVHELTGSHRRNDNY